MSTTEQRLAANRANARRSTGPVTAEGKAIASRNATRHGLLSGRLFLDEEDPAQFQELVRNFASSLKPVGALEETLVERIAVTVWRQRRLVQAETATLNLARQPIPIAKAIGPELGRGYGNEINPSEIKPYDSDREDWCRGALAEIEKLEAIDLRTLEEGAPLIYAQLMNDAEGTTADAFLAEHRSGLTGYIDELMRWCRKKLREAESRPHLMAIAEQMRAKRLVLTPDTLELLSRYQTTLDNQLYKALKALREAQEWRLKTLEAAPTDAAINGPGDVHEAA